MRQHEHRRPRRPAILLQARRQQEHSGAFQLTGHSWPVASWSSRCYALAAAGWQALWAHGGIAAALWAAHQESGPRLVDAIRSARAVMRMVRRIGANPGHVRHGERVSAEQVVQVIERRFARSADRP